MHDPTVTVFYHEEVFLISNFLFSFHSRYPKYLKLSWVASLHTDTFTPNLPFLPTKFAWYKSSINPAMHLILSLRVYLDKVACVFTLA